MEDNHPEDINPFHVSIANDVYVDSGISPMNSIVLARKELADEGLSQSQIAKVLLASLYADVRELNLRAVMELF
ncbi:hypothetical protein FDI24_gp195 [Acidovorax phage ACP17]|uniref:Uncharacterized protein n=1 Tax=Acidovorax phage ACP17 TaxID=2010329 RepID=A0A218M353_9CAUD|nr:hypothetical protein FDI24_gp195 [Acidovorax phage ACP17]ASD50476.1 hypothetical protein [Acidovorax phage ACP17]